MSQPKGQDDGKLNVGLCENNEFVTCEDLQDQLYAMRFRLIEWRDAYWRLEQESGAHRRTYPDGSYVTYRLGMTLDDII